MANYWLMKTEPDVFSFDDLINRPNSTDSWDGIRNYQARNFMRDVFKKGDGVLIYHSRIDEPAIVGVAEVVKEAYPDTSALNPEVKYFDPRAANKGETPWVMVDVQAKKRLSIHLTLKKIKGIPELSEMMVIKKGQRLSIQPVTKKEWEVILKTGQCTDI